MLILGIHGGFQPDTEMASPGIAGHDSAAILLKDGHVLAAIEEERLSRSKHTRAFPSRAIAECLRLADTTMGDIDAVALNFSEDFVRKRRILRYLDPTCDESMHNPIAAIERNFKHFFGVDVAQKLHFCDHHIAHALSAFEFSGFESALVVTLDGDGEDSSGLLATASPELVELKRLSVSQSLGNFYQTMIGLLGYSRFDEYKVMGLAPYGDPQVYRHAFSHCYELLAEGSYFLSPFVECLQHFNSAGFLALSRSKGGAFRQEHSNFAAALQESLVRIVIHLLSYYRKSTALRRLCLAGGVAQNSAMNGVILRSRIFEQVFIQPAAHDSGTALGAAMSVWRNSYEGHRTLRPQLKRVFWGTDLPSGAELSAILERWSSFVTYTRHNRIEEACAKLLSEGSVLAWMQGRAEFGPRALGNRSILADPRPYTNRERINRLIKERESYRPFAPAVLAEHIDRFFVEATFERSFPFMTSTVMTNQMGRDILQATTHVDGSARLQSVDRECNPLFWSLIHEFYKISGVPAVLNTSLNNSVEPIVNSLQDGLQCLLTSGLDYLAVGDYLVKPKPWRSMMRACSSVCLKLPPGKQLIYKPPLDLAAASSLSTWWIVDTQAPAGRRKEIEISNDLVQFLEEVVPIANNTKSLANNRRAPLIREVWSLWSARWLSLQPA